jgi:hypothetical protein
MSSKKFTPVKGLYGWGSVEDHILQGVLHSVSGQIETLQIARPLQTKPKRRGDLRQTNTCRKLPEVGKMTIDYLLPLSLPSTRYVDDIAYLK